MKTFIVFGGAGCGKTRYISRQIRNAVGVHGPDRVIATSFTKAAAVELIDRGIPVDEDKVGTLHALAYRAQNCPPIAEAHARQWSQDCGNASWAITGSNQSVDDIGTEDVTEGNDIIANVQRLRGRMIPLHAWPNREQRFFQVWTDWKKQNGFKDFTDLLEDGLNERPSAEVMFVDECNDLTPLQYELTQRWGEDMQSVVYAGDDLQCIYSFTGASPEHMLREDVPDENKKLLEQSYRLPRSVVDFSQGIASHISMKQEKRMLPRNVEGSVTFETLTGKDVTELVAMAMDYTSHGEDLMFLATCSYLLDPLKNELRKCGVPFHNPYRPKRSDWSPLRSTARGSASTAERLAAFLDDEPPYWTANRLRSWIELIRVRGNLRDGYKQRLLELRNEVPMTYETLSQIFEEYPLLCALSRDVRWLREQALASKSKALEYPTSVYLRNGLRGLLEQPKVILGTVHSVKGGESSATVILPEMSAPAYESYIGSPSERDTVLRTFYVATTRAKRDLVLLAPSGRMALDWNRFRQ